MNLLLFLGSGVSFQSGMPSVDALTTRILEPPHADAAEPTPVAQRYSKHRGVSLDKIVGLLKVLKDSDDHARKTAGRWLAKDGGCRSSGQIYRGETTTYEDLFYLCELITTSEAGLGDNAAEATFVESVEQHAGCLLEGSSASARIVHLSHIAEGAKAYIRETLGDALGAGSLSGLDLIADLANASWLDKLDVVTLNHDTLVEQELAEANLNFVDGFGARDGDIRWYNDAVYDAPGADRRLFKLHGSTNWYDFGSPRRPAAFVGIDVSAAKDGSGQLLQRSSPRPRFLIGLSKAVYYHLGLFADLHFRFLQLLHERDTILMSGYGWGDLVVNHRLLGWLERSKRNKIVLLHREPELLRSRSMMLDSAFDSLVKSGQLVRVRKWLSEAPLDEIEPLLK